MEEKIKQMILPYVKEIYDNNILGKSITFTEKELIENDINEIKLLTVKIINMSTCYLVTVEGDEFIFEYVYRG